MTKSLPKEKQILNVIRILGMAALNEGLNPLATKDLVAASSN
jgi:hypothetical protein